MSALDEISKLPVNVVLVFSAQCKTTTASFNIIAIFISRFGDISKFTIFSVIDSYCSVELRIAGVHAIL